MCAPVALGVASAVVGGIGAIGQYQAQSNAVAHQNAMARQAWMNQSQAQINANQLQLQQMQFQMRSNNRAISLDNRRMVQQSLMQTQQVNFSNIRQSQAFYQAVVQSNFNNLQQASKYSNDLAQYHLQRDSFSLQKKFMDMGLSGKLLDAQSALEDEARRAAFEGEKLMGTTLKAQGAVLARGQQGQTIGILEMDTLASYGREATLLNANLEAATEDYYTQATNAFIERGAQEAQAISQLTPMPMRPILGPSPQAPIYSPFPDAPILADLQTKLPPMGATAWQSKPISAPGPSGLGLVSGLGGAVLGGIQTGMQANAMINPPGSKGP